MTASFTENMAKLILISEESDSRFEKFCCDLFYEVDGILYLPTSQNYDQGRDGRTSDLRSGSKSAILCATLRKDPIKKASEDVEKIKSKPFLPCIIRSCVLLNKDKHGDETERLLDQIKATFSTIDGVKTVLVDGIIQIAAYAVKYPGIFEKYYRSELDNLRRIMSQP